MGSFMLNLEYDNGMWFFIWYEKIIEIDSLKFINKISFRFDIRVVVFLKVYKIFSYFY